MPGIEVEGYRIVVNTRDERGHRPHVHVIRGGEKCKLLLDASVTPYDIRMSRRYVQRARELVDEHFDRLMEIWERFNG